jgi:hypothetical protein
MLHDHTTIFEYLHDQFLKLPGLANTMYSAYTAAAGTAATAAGALADKETALQALMKEAERKSSKVRKDRAWAAYKALLEATAEQREALRQTDSGCRGHSARPSARQRSMTTCREAWRASARFRLRGAFR